MTRNPRFFTLAPRCTRRATCRVRKLQSFYLIPASIVASLATFLAFSHSASGEATVGINVLLKEAISPKILNDLGRYGRVSDTATRCEIESKVFSSSRRERAFRRP